MPQDYLAIHGVTGLVAAVGQEGRIRHFTGDSCEATNMESPTRAELRGVWVESPRSAWAVGDGVVLRWDGDRWQSVTIAGKHDGFSAVWGHRDEGLWFGAGRSLIHYRTDGSGGNRITTDLEVRAIWGSGPRDVWFLCSGRCVMRWDGQGCAADSLPGDADEEWNAIAGSGPDDPVWIVGISGLVMEWDRDRWREIDSGTRDLLLAACARGPEDLYVTTDTGQVRRFDGKRWRTVAFSAFGALRSLCFVDGVLWAAGTEAWSSGTAPMTATTSSSGHMTSALKTGTSAGWRA